jgi:hypothetical protein
MPISSVSLWLKLALVGSLLRLGPGSLIIGFQSPGAAYGASRASVYVQVHMRQLSRKEN